MSGEETVRRAAAALRRAKDRHAAARADVARRVAALAALQRRERRQ